MTCRMRIKNDQCINQIRYKERRLIKLRKSQHQLLQPDTNIQIMTNSDNHIMANNEQNDDTNIETNDHQSDINDNNTDIDVDSNHDIDADDEFYYMQMTDQGLILMQKQIGAYDTKLHNKCKIKVKIITIHASD